LKYRVALDSSKVLDKVTSQNLIEMDLFRKGFNSIRVGKVVKCRMLSKGITPFQGPQNEIAALIVIYNILGKRERFRCSIHQ
jgi:hypothetical protein